MKLNAKAALKLKIREMINSNQFSKQTPEASKTGANSKDKGNKTNG